MSAKAHYLTGLGKIAQNDYAGAIAAFAQAVAEDETFVLGHLGMSQALDRQGKVDDAIAAAKKAIELDPKEPLAHTSLSRLYQQKGMIDEAEAEMAISARLQNEQG